MDFCANRIFHYQWSQPKSLFLLLALFIFTSCNQGHDFNLTPEKQTFGQSVVRNGKVDILWVIDTSSSMAQHQEQLAEQASPLIDYLLEPQREIDFQMATITMDMGLGGDGGQFIGSPKILTLDTPKLHEQFRKKIELGDQGGNLERALESMKVLFEGEGNPNHSSFLREGAPLVVIFLTNEDDQSTGSPSTYIQFLNQIRPPLQNGQIGWRAHVVGVLSLESECRTRYNFAEPAVRLLELAEYSGGSTGEICTADLRSVLGDIRAQIVSQMTDFKLNRVPRVETIEIQIDRFREVEWGVVEYVERESIPQSETSGWTYIEDGNMIRFNGDSVPGEFDRVVIDFTPLTSK